MLQKPEASGRLLKWNIELSQFDLNFQPRRSIRGQALADFIAEFTIPEEETVGDKIVTLDQELELSPWRLYMDGAKNDRKSDTGVVLIITEG